MGILVYFFSDTIEFDNSYSYFRSKKLHFNINIEEPSTVFSEEHAANME